MAEIQIQNDWALSYMPDSKLALVMFWSAKRAINTLPGKTLEQEKILHYLP